MEDRLQKIKNKDWHLYVGYYDYEPNEEDVKWLIETIEQLKAFIENNELDLLMEFKDYFPNGIK